jgi:type VI secretion system secreted protein Hcp
MAFDAFVKIDGIEGESTDDMHQGWIEIQSFGASHSQSISNTASSAGGATAERADFHDFAFEKLLDKPHCCKSLRRPSFVSARVKP